MMAYSEEEKNKIFKKICDRIEKGESLRSALTDSGMPSSQTFYIWLKEDENKSKQYAYSTDVRHDKLFDEILEIADKQDKDVIIDKDGNEQVNHNVINRNRLQIDARKWALSKMNPKKYGDRVDYRSEDGSMSPKPTIVVNDKKTAEEVDKLINGK